MQQAPVSPEEPQARLLCIVAELNRGLHPRRPLSRITLESRFDRDLGLDSLARMELMLRVGRALGCGLPEKLLASADSPRDGPDAPVLRLHAVPARIAAVIGA